MAQSSGFSLHAGVAAEACERDKLERLCRYISRPAVASERLSQTADGRIRYTLQTPYRDGTTHVLFEPLDFLSRLAALVPSPGVNLTRYHGVFAPNHRLRAQIVPSRRGRALARADASGGAPKHVSLGWAQSLKRVFGIEIQRCEHCGGTVRIIGARATAGHQRTIRVIPNRCAAGRLYRGGLTGARRCCAIAVNTPESAILAASVPDHGPTHASGSPALNGFEPRHRRSR